MACHDGDVREMLPWFARAWRRPMKTRRMIFTAAGYLFAAACLFVMAWLRDGLGAWVQFVGGLCLLWIGGTPAATTVWRRANSPQP